MALRRSKTAASLARTSLSVACWLFVALLASAADLPTVHVDTANVVGPRQLEKQTQASVIRDYLESWQSMGRALGENRIDLLDRFFVGAAKEKLADTIREQQKLDIKVGYHDRSHNLKIAFYSPEGLSIQLLDTVEYDVEIVDADNSHVTERLRSRYVALLTPAERRWEVRILQAVPDSLGFAEPAAQQAVKGRQ